MHTTWRVRTRERWGRNARLDLQAAIQHAADQVAQELGMTLEEVLAEARALLAAVDRGYRT